MSQRAFIVASYAMMAVSVVGMVINLVLYQTKIIDTAGLIEVTLILSWLALTFSAYGNIISAQVNKKVENLDVGEVNADEVNTDRLNTEAP